MLYRIPTVTALLTGTAIFFTFVSATPAQDAVAQAQSLSRAFRLASERATPSVVTIVAKTNLSEERQRQLQELMQDPRIRNLFPGGQPLLPIPD